MSVWMQTMKYLKDNKKSCQNIKKHKTEEKDLKWKSITLCVCDRIRTVVYRKGIWETKRHNSHRVLKYSTIIKMHLHSLLRLYKVKKSK